MRKSITLAAMLLTASTGGAPAQEATPPQISVFQPGARVRLIAAGYGQGRIVGTVTEMSSDTVVLDTADVWQQTRLINPAPIIVDEFRHISLHVAAVDSVEVSRGRSRFLGSVKGAIRGAFIGGLYVGFSALSGRRNPNFRMFMGGFAQGAAVGAGVGIPVGYVFGSERWMPVTLPRDWRLRGRGREPQIAGPID